MTVESFEDRIAPVRKAVEVSRSPAEAFDIFTARISSWWPLEKYSVSQSRTERVVLEPGVGGAVYEVRDDGQRFPWGQVLEWDPPRRLVLSWHPGHDPSTSQEVEVSFSAIPSGTRVELEHRNWHRRGAEARQARDSYAGGWEVVLGRHLVQGCSS